MRFTEKPVTENTDHCQLLILPPVTYWVWRVYACYGDPSSATSHSRRKGDLYWKWPLPSFEQCVLCRARTAFVMTTVAGTYSLCFSFLSSVLMKQYFLTCPYFPAAFTVRRQCWQNSEQLVLAAADLCLKPELLTLLRGLSVNIPEADSLSASFSSFLTIVVEYLKVLSTPLFSSFKIFNKIKKCNDSVEKHPVMRIISTLLGNLTMYAYLSRQRNNGLLFPWRV